MVTRTVEYTVDAKAFSYDVEGEVSWGQHHCRQLENDDNLIKSTPWHGAGYTVEKFLPETDYGNLLSKIEFCFKKVVKDITGHDLIEPSRYHECVTHEQHQQIVRALYGNLSFSKLDFAKDKLEERVSDSLGFRVQTGNPAHGISADTFLLRVVRPKEKDNNPLHRDICLDRLRNAVNIYVPLWGSNEDSSLPVIPTSHLWFDHEIEFLSPGGLVNGAVFKVEAITDAKKPLAAIRPNPKQNELLLFSPYMIHGGARNTSENLTRISIELRFWRNLRY